MNDAEGNSRGFGFVNFADHTAAAAAVEALNGKEVKTKKLFVGRAQKKGERQQLLRNDYEARRKDLDAKFQGVNLYVKNLDDNVDDNMLRQAFEEFGTITSAKVMRDQKGDSRGFGFVCFSLPEEATKAVTEMNSRIIAQKPLYVALAQRKSDRQSALAQQRVSRIAGMRQMQVPPGAIPYPQGPMYFQGPGAPMMPYGRGGYPQQMGPRPRWPGQGGQMGGPMMGMPVRPMGGGRRGGASGGRNSRGGPQMGGGRGGPKFNQQVRNVPQQMPQPAAAQQPVQPQAAVHTAGHEPLTASALAQAPEHQQKQMLGERLYPRILSLHGQRAGKITGMLLEMDNSELLHMLEDQSALVEKASEALQVLEEHEAKNQA